MAESSTFFDQSKRGRGRVKHEILKYYLGGYFGMMGQTHFQRLIYIDGFAGPGQYLKEDGSIEEGSPIVAFKTVVEHIFFDRFPKILMIFIEAKEDKQKELLNNMIKIKEDYPNTKKGLSKLIQND